MDLDGLDISSMIDKIITDIIELLCNNGGEITDKEEYKIKICYPIENTNILHQNKSTNYQIFLFTKIGSNVSHVLQQSDQVV